MAMNSLTTEEESWLSESKKNYRELYIELDAVLRGIDRFFNTENLPIESEDISNKNFYNELIIIRDAILRTLSILEVVLPEHKKNAFWFNKFAATKFLSDQKRDYIKEKEAVKNSPGRCIFILYDSFINFKNIIADILKSKKISYLSFQNMGDIIRKEIRGNRYFNPFKFNINPEFDTIENRNISNLVKNTGDKKTRRSISMSFIFLFRQLRYISCIDVATRRNISLSCGLIILTLIRSEIRQSIKFFQLELGKKHSREIEDLFQPLIFQLSMELKRVYNQELRNILEMKNIRNIRGRIENSYGILKNLFEQAIVQIAEYYDPTISGENIFIAFMTRFGQSMKLREDIYILHKLLTLFEENINIALKSFSMLESLKNYMLYFESFTFKLLRYDDYEEFSKFFNDFFTDTKDISFPLDNTKLAGKVHNFIIFLETTLNHINNRSELQSKPLDMERAGQLLRQYI